MGKFIIAIIIVILAIGGLYYFNKNKTPEIEDVMKTDEASVDLKQVNDSGIFGTGIVVREQETMTKVLVTLSGNNNETNRPSHIHTGTCEALGAPLFPLNNVVNGVSETVLDTPIESVTDGSFAIAVHESPENLDVIVACGDIVKKGDSMMENNEAAAVMSDDEISKEMATTTEDAMMKDEMASTTEAN